MEASYSRSAFRYAQIAISKEGKIDFARCTCVQGNDGHCAHVAASLYCAEEVSISGHAKLNRAPTSCQQVWGRGSKRDNCSDPVYTAKYNKKRRPDKYIYLDPRPEALRMTTDDEKNDFLKSLQTLPHQTMWEKLLEFHYPDYELSKDRAQVLKELGDQFEEGLAQDIKKYTHDSLSNEYCVHVSGSEMQAESEIWMNSRKYRMTGSTLVDFTSKTFAVAKNQWKDKQDISFLPSLEWGCKHEKDARASYEDKRDVQVTRCGTFVSRKFPFISASPDGLVENNTVVIEIKCPFLLRHVGPCDVHTLTSQQQKAFPCEMRGTDYCLKVSHKYYLQCHVQMYVTGTRYCDFIM